MPESKSTPGSLNQGNLKVAEHRNDTDPETGQEFLSDIVIRGSKENNPVALVLSGGGLLIPEDEVKAYADLFAAAPETAAERDRLKAVNARLLEACKDLIDKVTSFETDDAPSIMSIRDEIEALNAAIAEAEKGE